jgi:hypothetical protein
MKADPDLPAFRSLGEIKHYAARRYAGVRLADVVACWVRYSDWRRRRPRAAPSDCLTDGMLTSTSTKSTA